MRDAPVQLAMFNIKGKVWFNSKQKAKHFPRCYTKFLSVAVSPHSYPLMAVHTKVLSSEYTPNGYPLDVKVGLILVVVAEGTSSFKVSASSGDLSLKSPRPDPLVH